MRARADSVRNYLTSRGVASVRMNAVGMGIDYPVASNATEAGRIQNRRVEIILTPVTQ
jgi:outer membrane protein OmpA-like peptidoglycan-associated protein